MWDYIVVGGGSAGCVVANRLSAHPNNRVLLIEAGGSNSNAAMRIPSVGTVLGLNNPKYDWMYRAEPDPTRNGRSDLWPRGKGLGGSSAINGMIYVRGERDDYNHWAQLGNAGWSFNDLEPLFKRMECHEFDDDAYGQSGDVRISSAKKIHPLSQLFIDASIRSGVPHNPDYNAESQEGVSALSLNTSGRVRYSSREAYIRPAKKRKNLEILTDISVDRIVFEGARAVGVEGMRDGERQVFRSAREVVLCAGSIVSPQILMLSGIGPASDLKAFGIGVRADLPVGQNLQEHPALLIQATTTVPSYNSQMGLLNVLGHGYDWLAHGAGLLSTAVFQALSFVKTDPTLSYPDIQLHFTPCGVEKSGDTFNLLKENSYGLHPNVNRPRSRGSITLRSADIKDAPRIQPNMLDDPYDVETLVAAAKYCVKLCAGDVLGPLTTGIIDPVDIPKTDAEWVSYVRDTTIPAYHPVGTCRMGIDESAVVGPDLRVSGVEGLRVADASIMPQLISGNTNAAAMVIGEKASDLILSNAYPRSVAV